MRWGLAVLFLLFGLGFVASVILTSQPEDLKPSLRRSFEVAGTLVKSADRLLSRIIPINDLDEKELGEAIRLRIEQSHYSFLAATDSSHRYLNELLGDLEKFQRRDLDYRAYVSRSTELNAYALPGGIIIFTESMIEALPAESALIAILAHEIAHIELRHTFDSIKFQLLARRLNSPTLGQIADLILNLSVRPSFSKTQESEADAYAFQVLRETQYDPTGLLAGFLSLQSSHRSPASRGILDDYFATHPHLEQRISRYRSEAERFWSLSPAHRSRYIGRWNIENRTSLVEVEKEKEWTSVFNLEAYQSDSE